MLLCYTFIMTDSSFSVEIHKLQEKLGGVKLPPELKDKANEMVTRLVRLEKFGGFTSEYENTARYIEMIVSLPWVKESQDTLDLKHAEEILDRNHYGLAETKERILEYLAVVKLQKEKDIKHVTGDWKKISRAPILLFVGLVGTGKTTLGYSIAEALGRKFERIPFGGMGDPLYLRGQSRSYPDAEPGQVIKALRRAGTKNPVILLDEIDRVAEEARGTIMGVLVELLDPEQNSAFTDHFIDFPFDLSEVLFVATCNNTTHISTAVLDRLEPIQMPSYTDEEKITIGKKFVFPKILEEYGIDPNQIQIEEDLWPQIVRPLGFDAGIRTLERTIEGIGRKIAKLIVEGQTQKFHLTKENIKEYLPSW